MRTLLLVEDMDDHAKLVQWFLQRYAPDTWEVLVATNLTDALTSLREASPDLLILDLGLPDSWGIATLLRVLDAAPTTTRGTLPIVVLTGMENMEERCTALGVGF